MSTAPNCFLSSYYDDYWENPRAVAYGTGSTLGAGLGAVIGAIAFFGCNAQLGTLNTWQSLLTLTGLTAALGFLVVLMARLINKDTRRDLMDGITDEDASLLLLP